MDINELKRNCLNCTLCSLHLTRKNVVFGDGNTSAKIMLIGEAPGANEDETGMPFVGRGGKLLSEMLCETGLSREKHLYIANILKCRPPENRDPKPAELKLCTKFLSEQINIIKPKIIVCVGRVAAQYLIDKKYKIMQEHGTFTKINGVYYTAVLHPAAVLRNINLKPLLKQDFITIKEKLERLEII